MRRAATFFLVGALAALGAAAAVDALRDGATHDERAPRAAPVDPALPRAARALRAAAVTGTLTFSSAHCELSALRLPALEPAGAPRITSCEPHVATGGIGVWKGDVVWSGFGYRTVQTVFSREELTRGLRRHGRWVGGGYRARQAVPLAGGRYGVLAEAARGARDQALVFVRGGRVERIAVTFVGETDSLRPSPRGGYVAVLDPGEPGVRVFTADGGLVPLPGVPGPHAIAWSPDERWTALATRRSVYVFPTERPEGPVVRIPVAVRDLDWSP